MRQDFLQRARDLPFSNNDDGNEGAPTMLTAPFFDLLLYDGASHRDVAYQVTMGKTHSFKPWCVEEVLRKLRMRSPGYSCGGTRKRIDDPRSTVGPR